MQQDPLPHCHLHACSLWKQTQKRPDLNVERRRGSAKPRSRTICNLNELKTNVNATSRLVALHDVSVTLGFGYGLQPEIDTNSHPEREMRCDQLFGVEHKGCSVLGKAALKRLTVFTSCTSEEAEPQQSFPRGKRSVVTFLKKYQNRWQQRVLQARRYLLSVFIKVWESVAHKETNHELILLTKGFIVVKNTSVIHTTPPTCVFIFILTQ